MTHQYMEIKIRNLEKRIKALEQEPCEDAISREAVLKLFATHDGNYLYEAIRELPSIQPQPKTGHWIFTETKLDRHGCTAECSSCHKKWKTYDEIRFKKEHNYCPKCGAKMPESEE